MKKTDKKIENQIRRVLTDLCEDMLKRIEGFQWLTHFVNYSNFPNSLNIVFILDTNEHLAKFKSDKAKDELIKQVDKTLSRIGIKVNNVNLHVTFDTEENCKKNNNGKWNERFR